MLKSSVNIIKSKNDKLIYKYLELQNKIKCVLIKDDKTEKSSAVLNVGIGQLKDPKEYQGIAHFLEHMLFMGKFLKCRHRKVS